MSFTIFYSWQSKTTPKYNKYFIEDCLKEAIKQLKKVIQDDIPDFYIDRDTKDIPGRPNIIVTLEEKIRGCDIFLGDVTYVAYADTMQPKPKRSLWDKIRGANKWVQEGISSSNVAEEQGIAQGALKGSERIVTVMNTAYGQPEQINFDSKQFRYPITYQYTEKTTNEQRQIEKQKLVNGLKERIRLILETHHERQKEHFSPFRTWKSWERIQKIPFPFVNTEYIQSVFSILRSDISSAGTIYRLCGLSGIGKTRILFECFNSPFGQPDELLSNKILYLDANDHDEKDVRVGVKKLLESDENKVLIIDNCSKELHNSVIPLISHDRSRLSLISVSINPEERIEELDAEQLTKIIQLDNQRCKETVYRILDENFTGLDKNEKELLVDFSSGIAFIATIMANNTERGQYQPGSLKQGEVISRLLGPIYNDENSRAVIYACSLFSKFGFFDDQAFQSEHIALNPDLCPIKIDGVDEADIQERRKMVFRKVCEELHNHQLLEKKGRTYLLRPSPLAVRMAEEWWKDCNLLKFQRILPILQQGNLVESFCEQFRYIKHVENAREIVKDLCIGFFNSAEVLDTNVGSRLFRSFIYVNPVACSQALAKAFLTFPKQQLEKMKEGRRNLVWALEKLCFRPETFVESAKVMACFAVAENENIANNATNQFLQLFQIQLPGTASDLEQRWNIIQYCLNGNEDYQSLGISAISNALKVGHFSRMGGAEDQGDPFLLEDYRPTGKQVYQYWLDAISLLAKTASEAGIFQNRAIAILKDRFYGLCSEGVGKLIIPVVDNLVSEGNLDRMEIRKQTQFILNSGRVFEKYTTEELQKLLDKLSPTGFTDKFKILVQQPSHEEYMDDEETNEYGTKLSRKVELLSEEFLQQKNNWLELTDNFMVSHLAEGGNFGKFIGLKADENEVNELMEILMDKMKAATPEMRNISVLLGIMSSYPDKELVKKIYRQLLEDDQLKQIAFAIARATNLLPEDISLLLDKAEKGHFSSSHFEAFTYGWGLKHLEGEDFLKIIQRIRKLDDHGKVVAFSILATYTNKDEDTFNRHKGLMREMILGDSEIILSNLQNTMDLYYYDEVLQKLLSESNDEELAQSSIGIIIEQSNQQQHYYRKQHGFFKILNLLQKKYFPVLWEKLSDMYLNLDQYSVAAFHLKELLGAHHDYNNQSEGLLFGGDPEKFETIFKWCKENKGRELYWIAELLPLFDKARSTESSWHPYAMKFINEFGNDNHFLSSISAKLGTYSWIGSVVPKLESDKSLFEHLLEHPIEIVREWAKLHLIDVENRIKWESNRDVDGII